MLPPLVAAQPENVKPVFVGGVGAAEIFPPEVNDPLVTAEPPLDS
jgi:hypothetical protein